MVISGKFLVLSQCSVGQLRDSCKCPNCFTGPWGMIHSAPTLQSDKKVKGEVHSLYSKSKYAIFCIFMHDKYQNLKFFSALRARCCFDLCLRCSKQFHLCFVYVHRTSIITLISQFGFYLMKHVTEVCGTS